jgi:phenylalanyl-tRNA synthetase alpha chain
MINQLEEIKSQGIEEINSAKSYDEIQNLRVKYLGKKGLLTGLLRGMGQLTPEERPLVGEKANEIKDFLEEKIESKKEDIKIELLKVQLFEEKIDITIPGKAFKVGNLHPLNKTLEEVKRVFIGMGFEIVDGPEIELDYYNFTALNTPQDHPARDVQDTFYITEEILLRTQTSPMQVRTMEKRNPPLKILAPGRVYRADAIDATHSPMFHQIEGLALDEGITMGDLKGVLITFARELFGDDRGVRFRPHHFPFTEPSAEMDISCIKCHGKGCRVCSHTGWLEILGAGMVHPNVIRMAGHDPNKYQGFAFGMGADRIAMLKYGIDDLRLFFESDLRFLKQF